MRDDEAADKTSRFFFLFPHAVSSVLMLADLLLMVPAQRMVTERDINAQVCGNHMPACN